MADSQVHDILTTQFTDRYLHDTGFDKLAFSLSHDPSNPLCDYNRTTYPANPKGRRGVLAAKFILGKVHHLSFGEIDEIAVPPFAENADRITEALQDYPVLLVNGHDPALQTALSLVSAGIALARHDRGRFYKNFDEMARISHVVGTRGFAPIIVGRPNRNPQIPFVSIAQWVMNPHLSFPDNEKMRQSALTPGFKSAYNDRFATDCLDVIEAGPTHPNGYHTLWSTPPGGTDDVNGFDQAGKKIIVTARVKPGTIKLVREMGVGLLPVYFSRFGKVNGRTSMVVGTIIPPNEVTDSTLPSIMSKLAAYRSSFGKEKRGFVYYADDPEVSSTPDAA